MRRDPSDVRLVDFQRIIVCGPAGSGKSTLAKRIALQFSLVHIELDSLFWEPGWKGAPDGAFFKRTEKAIRRERWVLDGNYTRTRHLTIPRTQLVIWLHYPLLPTFGRLFLRTVRRCRIREELWPGCRENWRGSIFSMDSILVWLLKSHRRNGRQLRECADHPDWDHIALVSFRSPRELEDWMALQDNG